MTKEKISLSQIDELLAKVKPHPRVVLIDDDAQVVDLLTRALHDEGYEPFHFGNAEDFLKQAQKIRPDAIVIELVLPGMSGLSALDELRPKSPEEIIPTLIISKKDDLRAKLLAFRRGAFDYVTKPFNAEEVAVRVRSLIRGKILQEILRDAAVSDPLTSLYNQRFLRVWLEREIERVKRYELDLSCLQVDLDGFQKIAKEMGEKFSDYLLREFAQVIEKCTRKCDVVGRIKDDGFLILLPGTTKEGAIVVARRLRQAVSTRRFALGKKKAEPSLSIGIAACRSKEAPDAVTFLAKAQEALARAKTVGSGQTAVLDVNTSLN